MFRLDPSLKVFPHLEPVDGRKNINGLTALVERGLVLGPFTKVVHVFANKRRDRIVWPEASTWKLCEAILCIIIVARREPRCPSVVKKSMQCAMVTAEELEALRQAAQERDALRGELRIVTVERDLHKL